MRCSSLWSQRLTVTAASTVDAASHRRSWLRVAAPGAGRAEPRLRSPGPVHQGLVKGRAVKGGQPRAGVGSATAALRGGAARGWAAGSGSSPWPPQVSCGRDGTVRAGRTTKAMCGRAGSLRPAQGQGDQGRAANCCALREAGQGLGTIELRGGGITGSEVYTFLSNLAIFFT